MRFLPRVLVSLLAAATLHAGEVGEGIVAVSAGIAPCVEALIQAFVARGGRPMSVVREATGVLARQMDQGAPYDVLVAADPEWPEWLASRGKLRDVTVCAQGRMVLWSAKGETPALQELGRLVVACPDPATTSHGRLARRFLEDRGLWEAGQSNGRILLVSNAVQGVLTVKGGSAQAAFIPLSLAQTAGGSICDLPGMDLPTVAGMAATSLHPDAKPFLTFLASPEAAAIWRAWGFMCVPTP